MTMTVGVGLKPVHFDEALTCDADGLWFEVHPENYMADGGPRLAWLERIAARRPLSFHGVALSLAADSAPDQEHLERLAALVRRFAPTLVSEHLAWSNWRGAYYPDLLPFPRCKAALLRIVENIGRAQDALGRVLSIENPSHYMPIDRHDWAEIDFIAEIAARSGCGLLLDVNNVHVSANNLGFSPTAYIDAFPGSAVSEIHLAGATPDPSLGSALLIDSHATPIAVEVWDLYRRLIGRIGPRPTLIERDDNVPAFAELLHERDVALATARACRGLVA